MELKNFLLTIILYGVSHLSLSQTKIDTSKRELTEEAGVKATETQTNYRRNDDNDDEPSLFWEIFGEAIIGSIGWTFFGDYENEGHLYSRLTPYPYQDKFSGNFESADTIVGLGKNKKNKFRIDIEDSYLYNGKELDGNYLEVKIRPFQYLYLQADYHQLEERRQFDSSSLSLFHFNLGYDRIRMNKFNFGWTLGAAYVANDVKKAGISFGVNADAYLSKQFSVSGSAKWGAINNKPVNVFETEGRYHIKRCFISLGYDYVKIGSPSYKFAKFGGGIYF
ncbi:MAG TPA: hypothetical protein VJL37_02590 [Flavobacterium sp.]|nr:hypothetical protein [Flavobacterium sp.]